MGGSRLLKAWRTLAEVLPGMEQGGLGDAHGERKLLRSPSCFGCPAMRPPLLHGWEKDHKQHGSNCPREWSFDDRPARVDSEHDLVCKACWRGDSAQARGKLLLECVGLATLVQALLVIRHGHTP